MQQALKDSVTSALDRSWILYLDTTIKSLYGHQEGAQIGYNPHKPGRPSHALHTYWVGNLRLVLDMQLRSGKEHIAIANQNAAKRQDLESSQERESEDARFPQRQSTILPQISP